MPSRRHVSELLDLLAMLRDRTEEGAGFALDEERLDLYGTCANCKS